MLQRLMIAALASRGIHQTGKKRYNTARLEKEDGFEPLFACRLRNALWQVFASAYDFLKRQDNAN